MAGTPVSTPTAAVGLANTQNTQAKEDTPVLNTGAVLEHTPSNVQGAKTFYSRFPGSRSHLPDGTELQFVAHRLGDGTLVGKITTDDEAAIKHLSTIVDKPGSQVFSIAEIPQDALSQQVANEAGNTEGKSA